MNKEEIKHFKSLLRQCSLRHMNLLLDDKFQKELLNIIKNYENLQKQNTELKDNWNKLKECLNKSKHEYRLRNNKDLQTYYEVCIQQINNILDKMQELEGGMSE